MMLKQIRWKRLAWGIFIVLYTALFFYNCLSPFDNWVVPYVFTMLLIIWLAVEYYQQNLFFQSGLVTGVRGGMALRALFALVFYASFVVGIVSVVGWNIFQFRGYPVIPVAGILLLLCSVIMRYRAKGSRSVSVRVFNRFYFSVAMLMVSIALGYSSYLALAGTVIFGLPLILFQQRREESVFGKFIARDPPPADREVKTDDEQWVKFLARQSAGRTK